MNDNKDDYNYNDDEHEDEDEDEDDYYPYDNINNDDDNDDDTINNKELRINTQKQLLEDIEDAGGLSGVRSLEKLCDNRTDIYGNRGDLVRRSIRNKFYYLKNLTPEKYVQQLRNFYVTPSTFTTLQLKSIKEPSSTVQERGEPSSRSRIKSPPVKPKPSVTMSTPRKATKGRTGKRRVSCAVSSRLSCFLGTHVLTLSLFLQQMMITATLPNASTSRK
jgi:hypothetical protein